MSRIGNQKIELPKEVKVSQEGLVIVVAGPKGSLEVPTFKGLELNIQDDHIFVVAKNKSKDLRKFHGLVKSLLNNVIIGVSRGFEKKLEMVGVGYRAEVKGNQLILKVGYSHLVPIDAPDGITFSVEKNIITVAGIDKALVGDISAKIRAVRKPEPYKGKGIRYQGEQVRRKEVKVAGK